MLCNNYCTISYIECIVSPSSVRGQFQKSKTTRAQQEITSFFKPTPKPVSQSHTPLDKNAFKVGNDGKV